ncbi:aminoacyl-tRNA hydrolase [bacterium]|mgnify:CR=1 FL=1|nr:aminoacyl-tRNA hydrolase [bacterium]|tara:strand:+ start:8200 stop:8550 length:351 start_codon:yes stop_codon:yes gene_type:complete
MDKKFKQIIILRKDLKMSLGKTCVQACHACLGACEKTNKKNFMHWQKQGQKKAIVKVENQDELFKLKKQANNMNLPNYLVSDAGLTELEHGTVTALAIGPAQEHEVDKITGDLSLL